MALDSTSSDRRDFDAALKRSCCAGFACPPQVRGERPRRCGPCNPLHPYSRGPAAWGVRSWVRGMRMLSAVLALLESAEICGARVDEQSAFRFVYTYIGIIQVAGEAHS